MKKVRKWWKIDFVRASNVSAAGRYFVCDRRRRCHWNVRSKLESLKGAANISLPSSLLIQLAKLNGLKVVGSVGSDEKVDFIKNELGADVAFNYKKESTAQVLAQHPFDIYFDNVNGETLDIALASGKPGARFLVSTLIKDSPIIHYLFDLRPSFAEQFPTTPVRGGHMASRSVRRSGLSMILPPRYVYRIHQKFSDVNTRSSVLTKGDLQHVMAPRRLWTHWSSSSG